MAQMIEGEEESGAGILVMIHKPLQAHENSCGAIQASTVSAGPNGGKSLAARTRREVKPSNFNPLLRTPGTTSIAPCNESSLSFAGWTVPASRTSSNVQQTNGGAAAITAAPSAAV